MSVFSYTFRYRQSHADKLINIIYVTEDDMNQKKGSVLKRNINTHQIIPNTSKKSGNYRKFILQVLHAAHFEVCLGKYSFQLSKTDTEGKKRRKNDSKITTVVLCLVSYSNIFYQHKNVTVTIKTFWLGLISHTCKLL